MLHLELFSGWQYTTSSHLVSLLESPSMIKKAGFSLFGHFSGCLEMATTGMEQTSVLVCIELVLAWTWAG